MNIVSEAGLKARLKRFAVAPTDEQVAKYRSAVQTKLGILKMKPGVVLVKFDDDGNVLGSRNISEEWRKIYEQS